MCTDGYKRKLIERGVPAEKIEVIYNWCDEEHIRTVEKDSKVAEEFGMAGKFNIVFAGNIGKAQSLSAVLDAARLVREDCPDVQFLFFGGGIEVDQLREKAHREQLRNVVFFERQPLAKISSILSLADVLLVHLKNDPVYRITIPSKTQAYMAIGRPILSAVGEDTNGIVERAGAGFTCEPEDAEAIAETVRKFRDTPKDELSQMGANGREFYQREMSFSVAVDKYEKLFEAAARKR